ncbi:hypothetical protein LTR70_006323 [Exophiala xenobiotica]|uniref:Uncharacterized protein n=1 Tax=Lithohypha guttulata TaxID=1690604 RepID=A0ABR0K9E7_9EURO|nr:hypothetical protein LTR24_005792 [Lithohypha guttulata]KAK5316268.1 hypothetical protein LTR70_006323 [Exophiala xenobiotica]
MLKILCHASKEWEEEEQQAPESSTKYLDAIPGINAARAHRVPLLSYGKTKAAATLDEKVLNIRKAIGLLFLLAEVPARPSLSALESKSPCKTETWASPSLSLAMEVNLVEVLPFLVSTTNDPYKVVALSLESQMEAGTAVHRLKIAANHGGLEPTKYGLERISRA